MLDADAAVDTAAITNCLYLICDGLRCGMPQIVRAAPAQSNLCSVAHQMDNVGKRTILTLKDIGS